MLGLALLLAALVGISLGLLGSGGSIVTLPILVYVGRIPPHEAVGMSLLIVGATSALGALLNLRQQHFDIRAALFFAASGTVGAFIGSKFTHLVSSRVLLLCFGTLMLVIGARMLWRSELVSRNSSCKPLRCLAIGLAVGLLTGFLGVGGGFVILPALVLFAGLEMRIAIGTSLAVIAVNSFAGLAGQLRYVNFNWPVTLAFMGSAGVGMLAGLAVAARVPSQLLRRGFACAVIALGLFLLAKNIPW